MNKIITLKEKNLFKKQGYLLFKNLLEKDFDKSVKESLLYLFETSLKKTGNLKISEKFKNTNLKIKNYLLRQHKIDKEIFIENIKLLKKTRGVNDILINHKINLIASELLNININHLLFTEGNIIPNMPKNKSLLYSFHSEVSWLPLRRSFINFWMPIINNKNKKNGTISLLQNSHKKNYPFYEYYGFNKIGKKDQNLLQYEIPQKEIKNFKEIKVEANVRDVLFFDQNLVHKSNINTTNDISYFFNCRYFDISRDLTFSSNLNIRPYSEESKKFGRPNIITK